MEFLRETQWLWWAGAALALGLIEIASLDLVFSMLALAAVAAAVAAYFGLGFVGQVFVFIITALALLALLRPLALRKLKPPGEGQLTNTAAHVGRTAVVLSEVTDTSGLVKLAGEEWTARTESGPAIPLGARVAVVRIEGATAVVAPVPADPSP